ncbi:MAG: hypothetical protein FOGNACKC_02435 [Anaerolineae bacterium]|nr:hypothetical protein [Anaerolineae bacterium]
MPLKVSVICTVLNEGHSITGLLNSLAAQTRRPDEVIFVDGGSTDDTVDTLQSFTQLPLRVIVAPGANISRGRNVAIRAAAGPIIASTDAGVRLDPNWLAELLKPFENPASAAVVSGFFVPDPCSAFEVAMGATVLPGLTDIDPATFLPSSRSVAFLKSAWAAAGGYPEWLDFCEDLIFDFRLRDEVGPFAFAPAAVAHFRPRGNLRAFFKQYYQYARGDGKADLFRKRHAIRYGTYLAALPLLLVLGAVASPWWWLGGALLGGAGLFLTPYRRLVGQWQSLSPVDKLKAAGWVPLIRITGDVAKMVGYPVGVKWRLERLASQPELKWQR